MFYYKLRIDTDKIEEVDTLLKKYAINYAICWEKMQENPHCHMYVESEAKDRAMRAYIRNHIGSGNGVYSLKSCEQHPIEYIAYMMKETRFSSKGIPEEIITLSTEYDLKVKEELKQKKKKPKIMDQLIAILDANPNLQSHEGIVYTVIDFYKEKGALIREFQMISQIQTLRLKYETSYTNSFQSHLIYRTTCQTN